MTVMTLRHPTVYKATRYRVHVADSTHFKNRQHFKQRDGVKLRHWINWNYHREGLKLIPELATHRKCAIKGRSGEVLVQNPTSCPSSLPKNGYPAVLSTYKSISSIPLAMRCTTMAQSKWLNIWLFLHYIRVRRMSLTTRG